MYTCILDHNPIYVALANIIMVYLVPRGTSIVSFSDTTL